MGVFSLLIEIIAYRHNCVTVLITDNE